MYKNIKNLGFYNQSILSNGQPASSSSRYEDAESLDAELAARVRRKPKSAATPRHHDGDLPEEEMPMISQIVTSSL